MGECVEGVGVCVCVCVCVCVSCWSVWGCEEGREKESRGGESLFVQEEEEEGSCKINEGYENT